MSIKTKTYHYDSDICVQSITKCPHFEGRLVGSFGCQTACIYYHNIDIKQQLIYCKHCIAEDPSEYNVLDISTIL